MWSLSPINADNLIIKAAGADADRLDWSVIHVALITSASKNALAAKQQAAQALQASQASATAAQASAAAAATDAKAANEKADRIFQRSLRK